MRHGISQSNHAKSRQVLSWFFQTPKHHSEQRKSLTRKPAFKIT
jgi:hypothetical protein